MKELLIPRNVLEEIITFVKDTPEGLRLASHSLVRASKNLPILATQTCIRVARPTSRLQVRCPRRCRSWKESHARAGTLFRRYEPHE